MSTLNIIKCALTYMKKSYERLKINLLEKELPEQPSVQCEALLKGNNIAITTSLYYPIPTLVDREMKSGHFSPLDWLTSSGTACLSVWKEVSKFCPKKMGFKNQYRSGKARVEKKPRFRISFFDCFIRKRRFLMSEKSENKMNMNYPTCYSALPVKKIE